LIDLSSSAETQAVEHRRQEVGQEHVRGLDQLQQDGSPLVSLEIDGHAALVAVDHLHGVVDRRRAGAGKDETAIAVATLGMLDLDDLGTPVRQQCARHRDEDPLRELDDTDTAEDVNRW